MSPLSKKSPVGFFDSGRGGLCVLNAFKELLPNENTVYVADSANCPYGNKPQETIILRAQRITRFLIEKYSVKMIVVACNTATAAAIDNLRSNYPDIPFIGIEPAIKPAVLHSKSGVIGVLATRGTFNGRLYKETSRRFAENTKIVMSIADEFVTLVESNSTDTPEAEKIVREKIKHLLDEGCDHIVLGCTHLPHLIKTMKKIVGDKAQLVEPSLAVAKQAKKVLSELDLITTFNDVATHIFLDTATEINI
jgi:glutamate racemase